MRLGWKDGWSGEARGVEVRCAGKAPCLVSQAYMVALFSEFVAEILRRHRANKQRTAFHRI